MLFLLLNLLLIQVVYSYIGCEHNIVGAGPGGLYTAYQLCKNEVYSCDNICIFEKTNRIGGRVYSVRDEEGKVMFEAGGARFTTGANNIVQQSLIEEFDLNTHCEAYLDPFCGEESTYYAYVGGMFYDQNGEALESSSYIIEDLFNLREGETWSTEDDFNSPWDTEEEDLNPNCLDKNYDKIEAGVFSQVWKAERDVMLCMQQEKVPTSNFGYHEVSFRTGLFDPNTGEVLHYSQANWDTKILYGVDEAEGDGSTFLLYTSKYGNAGDTNFNAYENGKHKNRDLGNSVIFVDENENALGYDTPLREMKSFFENNGGRIFYGHEAYSVINSDDENFEFILKLIHNKQLVQIYSKDITLNIDVLSMNRMSKESVMFTDSPYDFEKALKTFGTTPVTKVYFHYESSDWLLRELNQTGNAISTEEPLRYHEDNQHRLDCDINYWLQGNDCPVWANAGYLNVEEYTGYFDTFNLNREEDIIWLSLEDDTSVFLLELHKQYMDIFSSLLEQSNIPVESISPPNKVAIMNWENGWSFRKTFSSEVFEHGGIPSKIIKEPLPGRPLFTVNTDWSAYPGEISSSYQLALQGLKRIHNFIVPEIVLKYDKYYEYIIDYDF